MEKERGSRNYNMKISRSRDEIIRYNAASTYRDIIPEIETRQNGRLTRRTNRESGHANYKSYATINHSPQISAYIQMQKYVLAYVPESMSNRNMSSKHYKLILQITSPVNITRGHSRKCNPSVNQAKDNFFHSSALNISEKMDICGRRNVFWGKGALCHGYPF